MKRFEQEPNEELFQYDLAYMLPTSSRQITVTDYAIANQDFMDMYFPRTTPTALQDKNNKKKRYEWRLVEVDK